MANNKGIKSLWGYPLIDEKARNAIDDTRSNLENNYQKKNDDTLTTTNKTIVGGINEVKNDIPKQTVFENGKLYLIKENGTKIDNGTEIISSGMDASNYYSKDEINNIVKDYTDGKKQRYITKEEYDTLSEYDKNSNTVWNITNEEKLVIPQNLELNGNELSLRDKNGNVVGNNVTLNINNNDDIVLTSPSGYKFKAKVSDTGQLTLEQIIIRGNISLSTNTVVVKENEVFTVSIKLDKAPTIDQVVNIVVDNQNCTITPTSLTFTPNNYNIDQILTITGVKDSSNYDDKESIITVTSDEIESKTINVTITNVDIDPSLNGVVTDGLMLYFDSRKGSGTINEVPNLGSMKGVIKLNDFTHDKITNGWLDEGGLKFKASSMELLDTTGNKAVFGEENTQIRTIEVYGKIYGEASEVVKGFDGIACQHNPINYQRQVYKRVHDGLENFLNSTVVRSLNFPSMNQAFTKDKHFSFTLTDNSSQTDDSNNLCMWKSFLFGRGANQDPMSHAIIYAVRVYNRVLTTEEIAKNFEYDKVAYGYSE